MEQRDDGKIVLTEEEYDRLVYRSDMLSYLEAYGVDNWNGYEEAMNEMRADLGEED